MVRLFVTILANALGIYAATQVVSGFSFTGTYTQLAIAAIIFAIINWLIRPVLRFVTSPVIFITFGIFMIIVNMAMLWILDLLTSSLAILNLSALFWSTILIGFINLLIMPSKKKK